MKIFGFAAALVLCCAATVLAEKDLIKEILDCAGEEDTTSCATQRVVRSMDKLAVNPNIEILPGVNFIGDGSSSHRLGKALKEDSENDSQIDALTKATARLFAGRTLKIKFPDTESIARAFDEGSKNRRRKGGNKNKGSMMGFGIAGISATLAALTPLVLGKLALIATKALIIGKIALVLAGIAFFQMFFGRNSGSNFLSSFGGSSYSQPSSSYGAPQTAYGAPSSQYPYARSFTEEEKQKEAQIQAYSSYRRR